MKENPEYIDSLIKNNLDGLKVSPTKGWHKFSERMSASASAEKAGNYSETKKLILVQ